jgi:hypothetical protein
MDTIMDYKEEWRDIPGYEGLYQASSTGKIRSFHRNTNGTMLNPRANKFGYLKVGLQKNKKQRYFLVHRLVLISFEGNCTDMDTNHKDGDKGNNRLENLEYCSRSENLKHKYRVLKVQQNKYPGERNPHAKLTERDVIEIRALYASKVYKQIDLARLYNVSFGSISDIVNRETWKHI